MNIDLTPDIDSAISPIEIVQNCYVVPNLEVACNRLHQAYGIGPFVGGSEAILDSHVYRGSPAEPIRLKGVFVQSGQLNIELVEILSEGPCAFTDMYRKGESGLHHVALFAKDYDQTKQRFINMGLSIASEFSVSFGAMICYVDAREMLGHMIEVYSEHPIIRSMYQQTKDAAENWDRAELIVPWENVV